MSNEKTKSFDELNADEHAVLNVFREMKIECDTAKCELMIYQLNELISYEKLQKLREDILEKYFTVMKKINEYEYAEVDIDYSKWNSVTTNEKAEWNEELQVISEFKNFLDDFLMQLNDGSIEKNLINAENEVLLIISILLLLSYIVSSIS